MLINPPPFDSTLFREEAAAPKGCCSIPLETVNSLIVPGYQDDPMRSTPVTLVGVELLPSNCQFDNDPENPVLFIIEGRSAEYIVSIWADRLTVEICVENRPARVLFPQTEQELSELLHSIVNDYAPVS